MGKSLSRNAQILKYFAQQYPGIPRKRLVKMSYMADLVSRQFLGHPISEFSYMVYFFGPYAAEVPEAIAELENRGLAWTQENRRAGPDEPAFKKLFDSGTPAVFDFTLGENEVLAYVVRNFLNMDTDELIEDVVYPTTPFQAALATGRFKERIPMELVDSEGVQQIGFDLERASKAERQAEAGEYFSAGEYFNALRGRITARYPE